MLIISGCENVAKSRFVDYQEPVADWDALYAMFQNFTPAETKDALPLYMAAEYACAGMRRCAANVLRVHFLVLDMDRGPADMQYESLNLVERFGHIVHTTASHNPAGQFKFRALVKLSRPVDVKDWSRFYPRAVDYFDLMRHDPESGKPLADLSCSDPCHQFYVPGGDVTKFMCFGSDGPALNVDEVLARELPEGLHDLPEVERAVDESERGEITENIRDIWNAKLDNLCNEIRRAPFPGSYYELKSHGVYGVSRGVPHIISEDRVRNMVRKAIDARYRKAGNEDIEALRDKSYEQVDIAIDEGSADPWWPLRADSITTHPLTEYGLRERLLEQHGKDLAFEGSWRNWLVWTGQFWNLEAGALLVQERMVATVRKIPEEADAHEGDRWAANEAFERVKDDPNIDDATKGKLETEAKRLNKLVETLHGFSDKAQTRSKTSAGVELASSDTRVLVNHEMFNRDPYALNFQNGILDLRTGKLIAHRREAYLTRIVPYDFNPYAVCPTFDRFLAECMVDNLNLVSFLWRLVGYTAVGITSEQIMPMLIGDGANGKSTFISTLLKMFGTGEKGYGLATQSENLLTRNGANQHATWRMSMFGKRIVTVQEVEEGRAFNESLIKEITGSDTITGRRMRQDEWSYVPTFTPWFAANHLPHVRGIDEGIWRRLLVIPWNANFRGRADKNLPAKLEQEIPGIWARVAREAVAYAEKGLEIPSEVSAATEDYRTEQDPLRPFFDSSCEIAIDAWVSRDALWAGYLLHCESVKDQVFHERKRFVSAIRKRFNEIKRRGKRGFQGIRLLSPQERLDRMPQAVLRREREMQEEAPAATQSGRRKSEPQAVYVPRRSLQRRSRDTQRPRAELRAVAPPMPRSMRSGAPGRSRR